MGLLWWTAGITFLLSLLGDNKVAIEYISYVVAIRGITFVCVKMTEQSTKSMSQIIDMVGWGLAGVKIIGVIHLAMSGVNKIGNFLGVENVEGKSIWERLF